MTPVRRARATGKFLRFSRLVDTAKINAAWLRRLTHAQNLGRLDGSLLNNFVAAYEQIYGGETNPHVQIKCAGMADSGGPQPFQTNQRINCGS
jgi:hypothetical protein